MKIFNFKALLSVAVTAGGRIILESAVEVMQEWLSDLIAHRQT